MKLSVLIPWRPDHASRSRAFSYLLPLWESTGADICIGTEDGEGPFNCAQAQNDAFQKAKHDNIVMFGADCMPDLGVLQSACRRLESGEPWFPLFEDTGYYTCDSTERIISGRSAYFDEPLGEYVPFCTGVVGLTRATYHETGGMDERFAGWGMEDAAFRHTLNALYPNPPAFPARLLCLWHYEGDRGNASQNNWDLIREYEERPQREDMQLYLAERGRYV